MKVGSGWSLSKIMFIEFTVSVFNPYLTRGHSKSLEYRQRKNKRKEERRKESGIREVKHKLKEERRKESGKKAEKNRAHYKRSKLDGRQAEKIARISKLDFIENLKRKSCIMSSIFLSLFTALFSTFFLPLVLSLSIF